jgi:hypothetical protein
MEQYNITPSECVSTAERHVSSFMELIARLADVLFDEALVWQKVHQARPRPSCTHHAKGLIALSDAFSD